MKDGKHVILCVDDDKDFLDSMKTIIEADDYIIETASNAQQGLKTYMEAKPDLILVDLMMEEIDTGVNLVKEIKSRGATIPIFMLSSVGDDMNELTDYGQLGLAGLLQKPINPKILLSTLAAKLKK